MESSNMEINMITEFITSLREDIDTEYERCIEIGKQEYYRGNQNSVVGGLLFNYCISNGELVDALKLHKKIQEHDLYMLEENMPNGESEWCRINGEDFKEGEFHRQVCEMVKESFDRRCSLIKILIKFMKMDSYKTVLEICNHGYNKLKDYKDYVNTFLTLEDFDEQLILQVSE